MRSFGYLLGCLGICLGGLKSQAAEIYQTDARTVIANQVEVRSGPSTHTNFYSTSILRRGDIVQVVVKNLPAKFRLPVGWLAIRPPKGSFSWVNANLVRMENSKTATVIVEDAAVLIGSSIINRPPSVKSFPLKRGTILPVLDKPLLASDGSRWLPIEPPLSEVRFIPANAVGTERTIETVSAKTTMGGNSKIGGYGNRPEVSSTGIDPLWQKAAQAEAAGKLAEAEKLYEDVVYQTKDPNLQNLAHNRLIQLRRRLATMPPAKIQLGGPTVPATRGANWGPKGITTTTAKTSLGNGNTVSTNLQPTGGYGPVRQTASVKEQWSGPGWLLKTTVQLDGKQAYSLTNASNEHVMYVIAQPGFALEKFVNRRVNLYGPVDYRDAGGVRSNFLSARYVSPVQ